MYETDAELRDLQTLLDRSHDVAGEHLRALFNEQRRLSAERLCRMLTGIQVLNLATVTADCRPLVSPVDGLFFHGRFHFSSSPDSVRFRHIRRRPQVSASHTRGEDVAVIVHGTAHIIDIASPVHAAFRAHLIDTYGPGWESWGAGSLHARIDPATMFAVQMHGSAGDESS